MVTYSLRDGVVNILALNSGLNQASLNSVGHFCYLRFLEAMLCHSVYTGVLQNRHNWSYKELGVCFTLGLLGGLVSIDSGDTVGAVGSGHILALQGVLQFLRWDLNIFTLVLSLGGALLDLDHLILGGAVGCVVYERGAVGCNERKKRICLGIWFSNRHRVSNASKKCKSENLKNKTSQA